MAGRHASALPGRDGTGAEWLVPVELPAIPPATTYWAGDWFAPRPGADRGAVTPVSIAVLPGGTVHTWGTVMSQARDLTDDTHPAWSAAAWQARENGRPTRVAVGHADGRVETCLVAEDGTASPVDGALLPVPGRCPPDPCWGDPAGMPHEVCAARACPEGAAAVMRAAQDAALDGDWEAATHFHTVAAARLHGLGSPDAERVVRLAVSAWLRTGPDQSSALGFALVHLLISTFPGMPGPIAALLRRLTDHLPAADRARFTER
ncbi:hypothetical protein [Actinacidiphila bryophytorum]|uniref:Uncharacterized protein n=1 Tax=Actinacidiphila bryophytorum TaxID=1436133 RepID=A0A9W4E469_9ACTN|nr:hypothetical protein [Actinacidiphila bryophytorum]MBM9438860.1 hypothetical protein [Actinacidiphila bryophytorum]MBN6542944.1 hypothetical protein [Actinacidiphila bryophytorum]CAG7615468.1 conserved hypothetical protein [Actinacidiphila bryophytorum]